MKEHFLDRIYGEYQSYKASVLEENNGSIYARCYEIDCMITLYEVLKEVSIKMSDEELTAMLKQPNILRHLYELWLEKSDSLYGEIECHVMEEMKKLISNTEILTKRNAA